MLKVLGELKLAETTAPDINIPCLDSGSIHFKLKPDTRKNQLLNQECTKVPDNHGWWDSWC